MAFSWAATGTVTWGGSQNAGTSHPIRRMRQSPHVSAEGRHLFVTKLQVDVRTGLGMTSGQGSDPQMMLRVSKDRGHTWGAERWVSAGALGNYRVRAIWRRLGRGRDWVFQVVVTDPVPWCLIDGYLDVVPGTA